jgi:hypothetical protein
VKEEPQVQEPQLHEDSRKGPGAHGVPVPFALPLPAGASLEPS